MNDALYDSISTVEGRFNVDITLTDDEDIGVVEKTLHNLVIRETTHTSSITDMIQERCRTR